MAAARAASGSAVAVLLAAVPTGSVLRTWWPDGGAEVMWFAAAAAAALVAVALGALLHPTTSVRSPRRVVCAGALAACAIAAGTATIPPAVAGAAQGSPSVAGCGAPGVAERVHDISAIDVRIQYNRFGDHDPGGHMYVLDAEIAAVRAEEARREVSSGLGDDAIQPLVIRANLGECLVVNFRNRLTGTPLSPAPRASFHAIGLPYDEVAGADAVGEDDDLLVSPDGAVPGAGAPVTYRYFLDPSLGEGSYVVHSGGDSRDLTSHGLFGVIVAEPAGSAHLDPTTGEPLGSGWHAVIRPPAGPAFREFTIIYHEVGNEGFALSNGSIGFVAMNDSTNANSQGDGGPGSGAYRPSTRAINYRSESFMNRMNLVNQPLLPPPLPNIPTGEQPVDKSAMYSSYAFGEPATPIPRSYLGEPTKTRLVNAGSEMAHVHHLHGGATRWRRNPGADDTDLAGGLRKDPNQDARSIRLDSQTVSPGETFSLEHECGAGGCQQAAGDFLFHCHIAQHYSAGMWSFWRVYDTRQSDLLPLPGRTPPPTAVTSDELIGRVVEGRTVVPAAELTDPASQRSIEELVESQLPPHGARNAWDDATVWDWTVAGPADAPVYLGEPDDTATWPNYASRSPGERPPILFNPDNGRYAWPLLRPHLMTRPPFAPGEHGGAPWLGGTTSPARPDGLCPGGSPVEEFDLTAITLPIAVTPSGVDDQGQIFVLNEHKDDVRAGVRSAEPLVVRSNVRDCVDLTLTSELLDAPDWHRYSKVNLHTHMVQFDPQGSDGVVTGLSFEQSVRPYATEARTLTAPAAAGSTTVEVSHTNALRPGIAIAVGQGETSIETATVSALTATTVTLDRPLVDDHAAGESIGVEFVRYRWYADVDSGTVFFHDHVDGINSWDHGLFGAMIIEPAGSTYHDPVTGEPLRAGPLADIHTAGSVAAGQRGSFREFVALVHDGLRFLPNHGSFTNGRGAGEASSLEVFRHMGSINLRAVPLSERGGPSNPSRYSSVTYGDPVTPLWRAYVGDPVVVRTLGIVELESSLRITGHRFRVERFAEDSELVDAVTVGISERFDLALDGGAGGPRGLPGDYLYYSAQHSALRDGAWGIFRVHDTARPDLQPLPEQLPPVPRQGDACPADAPVRRYDVAVFAIPLPIPNNPQPIDFVIVPGVQGVPIPATGDVVEDSAGVVYSLTEDRQAILDGTKPVEPLAIRANVGECVEIALTNNLGSAAGLNFAKLPFDPRGSYGVAVGYNPDSSVAPGSTRRLRFFADRELGTAIGLDLADATRPVHGAYAALVVEPAGAEHLDPDTGEQIDAGLEALIRTPDGAAFREFVALFHDIDDQIGRNDGRYPEEVGGFTALNYRVEPFRSRLETPVDEALEDLTLDALTPGLLADPASVFSSRLHGDPATGVMRAEVGDAVRFRVAVPASEQFHVFQVDGHSWASDPGLAGSNVVGAETIGPGQSLDAQFVAGGLTGTQGDYLFRDHRFPFTEAGLWSILRVSAPDSSGLVPLAAPVAAGGVASGGLSLPVPPAGPSTPPVLPTDHVVAGRPEAATRGTAIGSRADADGWVWYVLAAGLVAANWTLLHRRVRVRR